MANGNGDDEKKKKNGNVNPEDIEPAMQLMGFNPELMAQAFSGADDIYAQAYGQPATFSESDAEKLAVLSGEMERLQPVQAPQPVGTAPGGNEYAVSTRGLSAGLQNLAAGLVNQEKRKELYGDPEKVDQLTGRAAERFEEARRMEAMANDMEAAGAGMGATDSSALEEIKADAQALKEKAQQDLEAAEQHKGVLMQAEDLQAQKEEAQQDEDFRQQFVSTLGREAYRQTQQGRRTQVQQREQTKRTRIEQAALTKRNQEKLKYGLEKARVNANAKIKTSDRAQRDPDWPTAAQPDFVEEFVPEYMDAQEDRIEQLEEQLFINGQPNAAEISDADQQYLQGGQVDPSEVNPKVREYVNLNFIKGIARQLELNATTFKHMQDDGVTSENLPEASYPTDNQKQVLVKMKQLDMPREMIDAYKFYNRISVNKAPQGPDNPAPQGTPGGESATGNPGRAFEPAGRGTGEWLKRDQGDNNESDNNESE